MAVQAFFFQGVLTEVGSDPTARMECTNNLKKIALAVHNALDVGECSGDICAQNSPPASPEPVNYSGGHFVLDVVGHSPSHLSLYDLA